MVHHLPPALVGTTFNHTRHYIQDIEKLCKRVIIIDSGRIFFDRPLRAIIDRFATHKIVGLTFAGGAECDFAALCLMKGFREDGWVLAGGEDAGDFQAEDAELG